MPPTNQILQSELYNVRNNRNLYHHRENFTVAQINAGIVALNGIKGYKYRVVDASMIAVGGAATTATDVRILGTRAAASVALVVNAIAGLTQNTLLRAGAANSTILAGGASFTPLDDNTPITVGKTGGNLAGATSVEVSISYCLEKA